MRVFEEIKLSDTKLELMVPGAENIFLISRISFSSIALRPLGHVFREEDRGMVRVGEKQINVKFKAVKNKNDLTWLEIFFESASDLKKWITLHRALKKIWEKKQVHNVIKV